MGYRPFQVGLTERDERTIRDIISAHRSGGAQSAQQSKAMAVAVMYEPPGWVD